MLGLIHQSIPPYDSARLQEAMAGLKVPSYTTDLNARTTIYCADVYERLDAIGYGEFTTKNPEYTIKLILESTCPAG